MRILVLALLATVALSVVGRKDAYGQSHFSVQSIHRQHWPSMAGQKDRYSGLGPGKTQVRGMFGDRALGETIRPRQRTFTDYSMRSYEGSFLGRGADIPSRMFKSFRSPEERSPLPAPAYLWADTLQPPAIVELVDAAVGQPVELEPYELGPDELGPEQSDIWFRSPPGSSDGGAAAAGLPVEPVGDLPLPSTTGRRFVRPLSTQYAIGFTRSGTGRIASRVDLSTRITRSLANRVRSPISVSFQDGTATLRGKVAKSHDRTLAGLLILMEPGVRKVDNRLTTEAPDLLSGGLNR